MKLNLSNENIFLLALCTFLLIIVLVFSFLILIPKEKEYRTQAKHLKVVKLQLEKYQQIKQKSSAILKGLQDKNKQIVFAMKNDFDFKKFNEKNKDYFSSFEVVDKQSFTEKEDGLKVYEANISSYISSPANFYEFIDGVNKGEWIVEVKKPLKFKKEDKKINLSFSMKVYKN